MFVRLLREHKAMTTIKSSKKTKGCQWNRSKSTWKKQANDVESTRRTHQTCATTTAATRRRQRWWRRQQRQQRDTETAARVSIYWLYVLLANSKENKHTHSNTFIPTHILCSLLTALKPHLQQNMSRPSAHLHITELHPMYSINWPPYAQHQPWITYTHTNIGTHIHTIDVSFF